MSDTESDLGYESYEDEDSTEDEVQPLVDVVNTLGPYRAGWPSSTETSSAILWVGVDVSEIGTERGLALGVSPDLWVYVKLETDIFFHKSSVCPRVVDICQAPGDTDLNRFSLERTECGLSWLLQRRMSEMLSSIWPPDIPHLDPQVWSIVEATGCSIETAKEKVETQEDISTCPPEDDPNGLYEHNLVYRIGQHLKTQIMTCNQHCLICGNPVDHVGVRPVVCSNELCIMGYEELGVGLDLQSEIHRFPDIVDLMFQFLWSAVNGGRIECLYPQGLHCSDMTFDNNKDLLREVCSLVPSVETLISQENLIDFLQSIHLMMFPLTRWMLSSNRSHLRKLSPEEEIPELRGVNQFVLVTGPVEKEFQFVNLRRSHGSFFAFHGSALGNWHVILRTGLKNMSNTKYMSTGAVHGSGIYLAKNLSLALGYARSGQLHGSTPLGNDGHSVKCVALCEVIDRKSDFTTSNATMYVVPQEEYVSTR